MAVTPNAEHIQFWNEVLVRQFTRFRHVFVAAGDEHSRGPLERIGLEPGMRALDIGCGFGETTRQIAAKVGPTGHVLGTDCCEPFLDVGRADAAAAGLTNITFQVTDAQVSAFEPEFDLAFARFGTMFFQSPVAGMRNVGTALRPGGKLLMIVWRPLEANPWMSFAKEIVQRYLPPPPDDAPNCGPGPFSMADPEVVQAILLKAGYEDVAFEQTDAVVRAGASIDEAVEFQLSLGPAAEIFRDGGDQSEHLRPAIEADMRAVLADYARDDGVWMGTSSWAVTARRAG